MKPMVKHMNLPAISFERVHYNVEGKKLQVTKYTLKYIEKIGNEDIFLHVPWPLKMTHQFSFKTFLLFKHLKKKPAYYLQSYFQLLR